jgi:hypothetical protein
MKVIYVAGRYRDSRGEFYVQMNIRDAEAAALWVWSWGGVALCPHKNTAGFGGAYDLSDDVWLEGDLELLSRCDAMWVIGNNWEDSIGVNKEIDFAILHHIPIFYSHKEAARFLGK